MIKMNSPFLGVVQFMHPGNEHRVNKDGWTPWNHGNHCRKYMVTSGQSVGHNGEIEDSGLLFWGEWEAPSRRVFHWEEETGLPENLVVPCFPGHARASTGLQNTDPYVFGNQFKYTLCKQSRRTGAPTFLTNLAPGTLLLFGSKVSQEFLLDTAFVVSTGVIHNANNWSQELSDLSDVYRAVTLEPMYWDPNTKPETTFQLYTGATPDNPNEGMFSFFPCLKETQEPQRFARPRIDLPGIVNHSLMMGSKRTPMSPDVISETWQRVKQQVLEQGLRLGTFAEEPQKADVPTELWPH
jgi:hypothetical protein